MESIPEILFESIYIKYIEFNIYKIDHKIGRAHV